MVSTKQATFVVLSLVLAIQFAAIGVRAQELRVDNVVFEVRVRSFSVGEMRLAANSDGKSYSVVATLGTTGVVDWFKRVRFKAQVDGKLTRHGFAPEIYTETAHTGKRNSSGSITYKGGVPVSVVSAPPAPIGTPRASLANQGGALDPVTAFYIVLRDVREDELCDRDFFMFDGTRRTRVLLSVPRTVGDLVICDGNYIRIEGFSPEDMAEQTDFPFTLRYRQHAEREGWFEMVHLSSASEEGRLDAYRKK